MSAMPWLSIGLLLLVGLCCVPSGLSCSGPSTAIRTGSFATTSPFTPVAGNQLLLFPVHIATSDVGAQISSVSALVQGLDGLVAMGVYTDEAVPKLLVQAGPVVADPGPRGGVTITLNADKTVQVPETGTLLLAIATVNSYNISSRRAVNSFHHPWAPSSEGQLPAKVKNEKPLTFIGNMEAALCL